MELAQPATHEPGLVHWHVVIGVTVQHINALRGAVAQECCRIAGRGGPQEHALDGVWLVGPVGPRVRPEADPACTRCNGCEAVGEGDTQVPGAMASHRMTC